MSRQDKITVPIKGNGKHMFLNAKGEWVAIYRKNGKQVRRSLNTADETEAAIRRDRLFAELLAEGATYDQDRRKAPPEVRVGWYPSAYIYKRKPFVVRVHGRWIGDADTQEEAEALRDAFFAKD